MNRDLNFLEGLGKRNIKGLSIKIDYLETLLSQRRRRRRQERKKVKENRSSRPFFGSKGMRGSERIPSPTG